MAAVECSPSQGPVDVSAVVDAADYVGLPLRVTVISVLMMIVDGIDLQSMSFVAPALVADWGVTRASLAPVLTASIIGMAFGSFILGWLSDRIGRKAAFTTAMALLAVGSLFSAVSHSLWTLFAWRFVTGLGLGGTTPLAATLVSEWVPKRVASIAISASVVVVPVGGMIGAMLARQVIPTYGWRTMFGIGAILPLLFVLLALYGIPESPKFLARSPKRKVELARLLNQLTRSQRFSAADTFALAEPPKVARNWLLTILGPRYLRTTLLVWVAFLFNTMGLYFFVNWLPTLLSATGVSQDVGLRGATFFNLGGSLGAIGGAALIGRFGSRTIGSVFAAIGMLATAAVGVTLAGPHLSELQLFPLVTLAGLAFCGMQGFCYAVASNAYPTYVRGTAVGCAQTVSRAGGILSSALAGTFLATGSHLPISLAFYAVGALMSVLLVSYFLIGAHFSAAPPSVARPADDGGRPRLPSRPA
jgi:AAHS family 4-hydroxybenzoate transporter-like MFS transporter